MKKSFLFFLGLIICCSCTLPVKIESNFPIGVSSMYNKGYVCKIIKDENRFCKIYFLDEMINTYVLITYEFYPHSHMDKIFGTPYYYDSENYTINNSKIEISKNGNLIINNVLENNKKIGSIELIKETNMELNSSLNGTYSYNNHIFNIDVENNKIDTDLTIKPQREEGIHITQLDKNIILLENSLISEFPLYYYEIDNQNNLILYPIIGNYWYSNRIFYTLKRQN
ncbi:MAG: hypothetical protein MR601_02895 [Erysipelotrichaceae bacterium]|nr:hypothetical protein [Erysipelotrichaceae bacterium]